MKKIFVVDWLLMPFSILSILSGFGMHIAGHDDVHDVWHNWAVFHVIASALFLGAGICHVVMHWGWYKGLVKNGIGRKSKITAVLSLIFVVVTVTGFVLLFGVDGANSGMGLWHYRIGIAISIIAVVHIIKRLHLLKKSLK